MFGRLGWCALIGASWMVACAAQAHELAATAASVLASADARDAAAQAVFSADHAGRPFAVVDKRVATLSVYAASGELVGRTPVLIGLARGDRAAPDIASRRPSSLAPFERTTPAGRYLSEPGHNDKGEDIVWIDYDASLAIHRLRPAPPTERRPERLASANPDDKRISYGCIVVPVAFYDEVVRPTLGSKRGVVYVLPEGTAPLGQPPLQPPLAPPPVVTTATLATGPSATASPATMRDVRAVATVSATTPTPVRQVVNARSSANAEVVSER